MAKVKMLMSSIGQPMDFDFHKGQIFHYIEFSTEKYSLKEANYNINVPDGIKIYKILIDT